jgi:hypothetical protein
MEYMGIQLRIGKYVSFMYDNKPRWGRIETIGMWGFRIRYAIPHDTVVRYAYRSFNYVDKVSGEPKITQLEIR